MWFDSWNDLVRVLLVGAAAYGALIVLLRISGNRTLAQLNAFDFIVTVALGSVLATILLNGDVSWLEGVVALALLVALQFGVALAASRRARVRDAVTARPALVFHDGALQPESLRRNRLSESDVRQAVRSSGFGDLKQIGAVVLETNGNLSVIPATQYGDGSTLQDASAV